MTSPARLSRVHLVAGGFPRGSSAGHDIDYARLRLLQLLQKEGRATTSVANDFSEIESWLPKIDLLVTYTAGPYPDEAQCQLLEKWLSEGGRWLALHGSSGGRTVPLPDGSPGRMMSKAAHHDLLGCFFLNHPPARRFNVAEHGEHALTSGLPESFEIVDELYLIEPIGHSQVLLTTELAEDPSPPGFARRASSAR